VSVKSNGTAVAALLFAALAGFFVYQWWFNPTRAVQRRLNEIAAALSIPEGESAVARARRAATLRTYLADDLRLRAGDAEGEPLSRDAAVGAVAAFPAPPGGWNIQFVDVQIRVDHSTNASADASLMVEINARDPRTGQPTADSRSAALTLARRNGEWVVTTATAADRR
jgi:hypothetical protein